MKVKFTKLNENAVIPVYSSEQAAGADLYNSEGDFDILPGQTKLIGTGIAMQIPVGYVGLVFARSGLACKQGLAPANKVGVIDSDYRGEIKVALHNHSQEQKQIKLGERMAQLVVVPYLKCEFEEVGHLEQTDRGAGGFGSTGK
ncbi:MAG: dUTP diphosphatase [Clostridia bacterium]|nr:dUTP diphosphatase [Clostridia bacterium]